MWFSAQTKGTPMDAVTRLIEVTQTESLGPGLTKLHVVSAQWPELAVALAELFDERGMHPPGPLGRMLREAKREY